MCQWSDGSSITNRNTLWRYAQLDLTLGKLHLLAGPWDASRVLGSYCLQEEHINKLQAQAHTNLDMELQILRDDKMNFLCFSLMFSIVELAAVVGAKVPLPLDHTHH